jgi:5-methylcytosine-specific restriction enzyme A
MNRKEFILAQGATCRNWRWSWAYINESERQVLFGAWDTATAGSRAMILSEDWEFSGKGRRQPGYTEAREYLRRVEEDGYKLLTFPMTYSSALQDADGFGPARIEAFTARLTEKMLIRAAGKWYAWDLSVIAEIPEEIHRPELYWEGASTSIAVNAYERSKKARAACLAHHGRSCKVCGFEASNVYGTLGDGVIHVHHVVPIAQIKRVYKLDPIRDLVPVCPNCHAVLHSTNPALTIDELRRHLCRDDA